MSRIKRAVSLYSYQDSYARKRMNLEDMFKEMKDLGAEGVELISDQMIKNSPFPTQESIDNWKNLCSKYDIKGVCNSMFINSTLYRNRRLTAKEQTKLFIDEINCAADLGFDLIRLVSQTLPDVVEPALDIAIKRNVKIGMEIHAGQSFDQPMTEQYCEMMKRVQSPYIGLVFDAGIVCKKHPNVSAEYFLAQGLSPEVRDYIDAIFATGTDFHRYVQKNLGTTEYGKRTKERLPKEAQALIKNPIDLEYMYFAESYENTPFEELDEYMPYLMHIHGKCYEMTEDYEETSIKYKEFIEYLNQHDYDGYIATEYEGNRFVQIDKEVNDKEQVRRHQMMLKKYLGE